MDESNFLIIADDALQSLHNQLEEELADHIDAELDSGVLTLKLETGQEYVINRHLPNRQIWMSSPLSGGIHFNYLEESGRWVSARDKTIFLRTLLASELGQLTGVPFFFDHSQ